MASIRKRNNTYSVIYNYTDKEGNRKQKWETYATKADAMKRKKEIEYKQSMGTFTVPQCICLKDLLREYVDLYGKDRWAISTYGRNNALINNYILPMIGDVNIEEINTRFLEKYYQQLLVTEAVPNVASKMAENEKVGGSTIRDVHKLLRSCFAQAVKWELMEKNPATNATVPKYKSAKREIWTAETLMQATEVCEDEILKISMNLAFSGSLRIGEIAGLTWDCVDISPEAIEENRAYVYVNKEFQRVSRKALKELDGKDILVVFPPEGELCKTVRVLKAPKTESSYRRIYLPESVAEMMAHQKEEQAKLKKILGKEYNDYGLVMATQYGMPIGSTAIRQRFTKLIEKHDLPKVVFHSLRHTSVTYKLKLNGGDIKSVQGDSGHAQVDMVTEVYSHIVDEDRRKNAEIFEEAFYKKKNLNPRMHELPGNKTLNVPDGVDTELLEKVIDNPEMLALLTSLAKSIRN